MNRNEPEPPKGHPQMPAWLRHEAKKKWEEMIPLLEGMGVLTSADGDALAMYCRLWVRWHEAEQFIEQHGSVHMIKDQEGRAKYLQQVPQVGIARQLAALLRAFQQEFGLTPSSRSQIAAVRTDEDSEFDKWLAGG